MTQAIRAQPPPLSPAMSATAGFRAIARACLAHLDANAQVIIATGDAEAIHQARVALRRLRAALSLFAPVLDEAAATALRRDFAQTAAALAPARELHVLASRLAQAGTDGVPAELLAHILSRQARATNAARAQLAALPFRKLTHRCAAWLDEAGECAQAAPPLPEFARKWVKHRRRKLRKAARDLATLSDAERHALRIRVKKLRYAASFFAPLDRTGAWARYEQLLGRLQDCLGTLNDLAVADAGIPGLFDGLAPATAAQLAAALAEANAASAPSRRRLLADAARLFQREADFPALTLPELA